MEGRERIAYLLEEWITNSHSRELMADQILLSLKELGYTRQCESLFRIGDFTLHSGSKSDFKIDCDALTDEDWKSLAYLISQRCKFKDVRGVPEGGLKLQNYLSFYCTDDESLPTLIVDDVLTTGNSMEEARSHMKGESIGYVVFARRKCPDWIKAISQLFPDDMFEPVELEALGDEEIMDIEEEIEDKVFSGEETVSKGYAISQETIRKNQAKGKLFRIKEG